MQTIKINLHFGMTYRKLKSLNAVSASHDSYRDAETSNKTVN
jgi:hypothetical protein